MIVCGFVGPGEILGEGLRAPAQPRAAAADHDVLDHRAAHVDRAPLHSADEGLRDAEQAAACRIIIIIIIIIITIRIIIIIII